MANYLHTYLLNGQKIGIDLETWGDIGTNKPFIISTESHVDGYENVTSIENWDASNYLDWARRRDEIVPLFYSESGTQLENFTGMSVEKKIIACKYFLIPYEIRIQIISDSEDMVNWDYLLRMTKSSREACVEAMRIKVGQYMRLGVISLEETQDFFKRVYEYIVWFNETNCPDFKQWIVNEVGTPYENNGFKQMPYYKPEILEDLMNIYNGNY